MNIKPLPVSLIDVEKKTTNLLISAVQSMLLLFYLLFPLTFMELIVHEGGHAVDKLTHGFAIKIFYAHPFSFNGYVRPFSEVNSVWRHASGAVVSILISLLIFVPLWKHRSFSKLPLLMLFPWIAIKAGIAVINIFSQTGDYYNIIQLTGMSPAIFYVLGFIFTSVGIFFFVSLFPFLGLAPQDIRSFCVLPVGVFLWCALSILIAHLFVPGSPIDVEYHLGAEIITSANSSPIYGGITGAFLAMLYSTLYRGIYQKLPAGLRTSVAILAWKDLRIPGVIFMICVILGIIAIS